MENERLAARASDFGALLRHYRREAGLSQEALAERARMSANGVGALERGGRTPQRETLSLLATALKLDALERAELEDAARSARSAGSVITGPWARAVARPLPLSLSSFIGRQSEIADIASVVRIHRLVTVTGAGGIGKTQTALRVASALMDSDVGAIAFVPLAPIGKATLVVAAIASALGVQEVPGRPLLDTLLAYLRAKKLLLVIDNAEHVAEETARVVETLLQNAPELRVLVTSRSALRVGGERLYRLPSLEFDDAVQLFVERAKAVDFRFALTDRGTKAVESLCRRLDGIPLAIELAAARVEAFSVEAISAHLDDSLRVLSGGSRASVSRHQTMTAAIDWSYNLLLAGEQRVFERLAIFAGGGTLVSATTVCSGEDVTEADVSDLISSLVAKSLVVADLQRDEVRFSLLEPFRAFALERLATRSETQAVAHRHAVACVERADRLESAWENESDAACYTIVQSELDNWRAALDWTLVRRENILLGQELAGKLARAWTPWLSGVAIEGRNWTRLAFQAADARTPRGIVASLAFTIALISWNLHDSLEEVVSTGERAVALYRELADTLGVANAESVLGLAYLDSNRVGEAKKVIEEGLEAARSTGHLRAIAYALRCLAHVKSRENDPLAGRRAILEAIRVYEECRADTQALYALIDLFMCCGDDLDLGLECLTQFFETARSVPCTLPKYVAALNAISICYFLKNRYEEAFARAREAFQLTSAIGSECYGAAGAALCVAASIAVLQPRMLAEQYTTAEPRAARLLGFTHADPYRWWLLERFIDGSRPVLALLEKSLGDRWFEQLMSDGSTMTKEQAVAEAFALFG